MLYGILLLVTTVGLVVLSALLRVGHRKRSKRLTLEPNETFLSKEIGTIIANAGGIYISLTLAASFLHLELAGQLVVYDVSFDPVAAVSLFLALVQPLLWPRRGAI